METVTENTETKSVKNGIKNKNSLGLFLQFLEITVYIKYFTVYNNFGIFQENIKSELIFIKS